jgi:two-component system, LytTR family, response regulator
MLRAIIIDDELAAVRSLELLINTYCPDVSILGKGHSVVEGIDLIKKLNPDIVFLDIEMPQANGFELLERIPDLNFEIIFITAYNQYAVKAFKYSAIDYILKPIDIDELVKAVEKVSELRKAKSSPRERYAALFNNIEETLPKKLVIPKELGFQYIDLNNVLVLKTVNNEYVFSLTNGSTFTCAKGSLDVEVTLAEKGFLHLNSCLMINVDKIEKLDKRGNGIIVMEGGLNIPIEESRKDQLVQRLEKISFKGKS